MIRSGPALFPFDWEGYAPYNLLPPLPELKQHKQVALTPGQLGRLAGRYAISPDEVRAVTVENGHLVVQEGADGRQELLAESLDDFYSTTSTDECTFKPAGPAPA